LHLQQLHATVRGFRLCGFDVRGSDDFDVRVDVRVVLFAVLTSTNQSPTNWV
jgi:hypothetical protein